MDGWESIESFHSKRHSFHQEAVVDNKVNILGGCLDLSHHVYHVVRALERLLQDCMGEGLIGVGITLASHC